MKRAKKAYKTHGAVMGVLADIMRGGFKKKNKSSNSYFTREASISKNASGKPFRLTGY